MENKINSNDMRDRLLDALERAAEAELALQAIHDMPRPHADDVRNAALEEAAKIADQQHFGGLAGHDSAWTDCAAYVASSIRAIKRQDPADIEGWDG